MLPTMGKGQMLRSFAIELNAWLNPETAGCLIVLCHIIYWMTVKSKKFSVFPLILSSLIPEAVDVATKVFLWLIDECGTSIFSCKL